jgi:hypothetical protein
MAAIAQSPFGFTDSNRLEPAHLSELGVTCSKLFDALGPLHRLTWHDAEVLAVAAGAMRPAETTRPLSETDDRVIDGALDFAAEALPHFWPAVTGRLPVTESRRALWIAAILRLALALQWECGPVDDVYAAWTKDILHLEVDSPLVTAKALSRVRSRVAAIEFVTDRRVLLTSRAVRVVAKSNRASRISPSGVALSHG